MKRASFSVNVILFYTERKSSDGRSSAHFLIQKGAFFWTEEQYGSSSYRLRFILETTRRLALRKHCNHGLLSATIPLWRRQEAQNVNLTILQRKNWQSFALLTLIVIGCTIKGNITYRFSKTPSKQTFFPGVQNSFSINSSIVIILWSNLDPPPR